MKPLWLPVVLGTMAGFFGCLWLYPFFGGPELFNFWSSDLLGKVGILASGLGGAICGGLGAAIDSKQVRRRARTLFKETPRQTWFVIVVLVLVIGYDLISCVASDTPHYTPFGRRFYFVGGAFFLGIGIRYLHDSRQQ